MGKFRVYVDVNGFVEVEAEDEDDAMDKAEKQMETDVTQLVVGDDGWVSAYDVEELEDND